MRILITGPQGSGKSTQAQLLASKLSLCFISAGDLVRKAALEKSAEGKLIKGSLSQGLLVDDKIVASLVKKEIAKEECCHGFVLDGYPRNLGQLNFFDPKFDKVIYLDVEDKEVEERLLRRGREDDTPEIIRQRLGLYHQLTEPVLDYYQKMGKLIKIDGSKSIEEVEAEIEEKLRVGS